MEDKTVVNLETDNSLVSTDNNETESEVKPRKWVQTLKKVTLWTIVSLVATYFLALVILYPFQKSFMYKPRKHSVDEPVPHPLSSLTHKEENHDEDSLDWHWKKVAIKTEDDETLSCYWIKHFVKEPTTPEEAVTQEELKKKELFTVIYFHGREGSIHKWTPVVEKLMTKVRCNVLMVSYRGYGHSTGSPDEEGMKKDAQAALKWTLESISQAQRDRLVVYGQSMGGAVAIHLASKNPKAVKYLMVENTFLSLPKAATRESIFFTPFTPFIHQIWDSEVDIQKVTCPILFLSAKKDRFIPQSHMKGLFELATAAERKTFASIAEGGHSSVYKVKEHGQAIEDFLYSKQVSE